MTTLSCVIEDGGDQRTGIINKQPAYVSLADIKAELNITQEGVYLAKTPDGAESYHWSIIVNDQDVVPCLADGSISIKVRPTFPGYARLVYQVEGTFDPHPHVCMLAKLPTQVLLKDVLSLYRGYPGTFFFKEFDPDVGSYHWTVVSHEDELVPTFDGQIICKVRLHPQKKEGQWTVLAFHTEGVIHPNTTRIPKCPSQVTVQDVRQGFLSIHGVMPGEMFVKIGNQYISLQDPDVANNPLHSTHCLIQIKVRPFPQLSLAPIQPPPSNNAESFMPVFDPTLLPPPSNLHPAVGSNIHSHHASPPHQSQHVLHHPPQQISHPQSAHQHLPHSQHSQQQHSQHTLPPLPQLSQLPHLSSMHHQQLHHLQLHHQLQQHQLPQQLHHSQQPHQLQQHQIQQHQMQQQHQLQQHQIQQHQLQQQHLQQHQMQHQHQLHHQQLLQQHQQLQHIIPPNTGLSATEQLLSQESQQLQDGQTNQSEQEQDPLHQLQRSQDQYQEQPSEFSQTQELLAHQHLEESAQTQEFQPQELTQQQEELGQQQQEELSQQQQEELAQQTLEPTQELEAQQEMSSQQEEQGTSAPQEQSSMHVDMISHHQGQENFEHQENY